MGAFRFRVFRWLDKLYKLCGYFSACCIFIMLVVIMLQVLSRWSGLTFPGATKYAGYLMGAGTFLALAYTFHEGGHIRVGLFVERLGRFRAFGELWCLLIGSCIAGFITWHTVDATFWSYKFGDVSSGQDAVRLWIPQLFLSFGSAVFTIVIIDHFFRTLFEIVRPVPFQPRTRILVPSGANDGIH